ncbi:probable RNA-binding protein 19 [Musca vetustissima]|uniref:probable RNA-binding protein 19 n=1 Tax=Musca vetustissima TaxID=27455 RepID=UPI002AB73FE9|nr:probable RNA-binding protein 19 [Musca vetustissima]
MSRIIVKQLPKNVTEDKLRSLFGQKGTITDMQLKYTPDGKFRQFCFIGYQTENEAAEAIKYFNNSTIQTSRIKVELCAKLGGEEKPQSWSKYAKDNKKDAINKENKNTKEVKEKEVKTPSRVDELLDKHKDDPEFQEFMKVHERNRTLWANDATEVEAPNDAVAPVDASDDHSEKKEMEDTENDESNSANDRDEDEGEEEKLAEKPISDMEYMKSLMAKNNQSSASKAKKTSVDLFTIKIHNVPYQTKRQDIIKFFKPLKPFSVRLPTNVHGFCYVGFKTEKDMNKAMLKNKSFIKGKQVFFSDFTEKNKITKAKQTAGKDGEQINQADGADKNSKWKNQEASLNNEEDISESGRIFFRNLAYTVTEDDLQKVFEEFGPIAEIHLPVDSVTRQIKGFGTVTYVMPEHAVQAFNKLDGTTFHGRLLHLIPGKGKKSDDDQDENDANLTFKQKKALKLKKTAQQSTNWNTLFLGPNAVAEILAKKFETSKQRILDTEEGGSSAAVRIALGETQIVIEMKKFLEDNGVRVNAFDSVNAKRSKTIILAKNLPPDTTVAELTPIFAKFGPIGRLILPPSGVTAIIEFCDPTEARHAFKKLAYSKFKNVPLYLEWGPEDTFTTTLNGEPLIPKIESTNADKEEASEENIEKSKQADEEAVLEEDEENEDPEPNTTLFLRNLNFKTVRETVYNHFKRLGTIHTVEIAKRKDPENPSQTTSLGYGFIQFKKASVAEYALKNMQFTTIDGNQVELKRSDRILKTPATQGERKKVQLTKQTGTKILVRNIPFQAKVREVRDIFKAFGELRSVRLPKKMAPGEESHRGFGFVDFVTKSDAKKAFEALSQSTHLYGRRIVLEWASTADEDVDALRKRSAAQFNSTNQDKFAKRSKRAVFDASGSSNVTQNDDDNFSD